MTITTKLAPPLRVDCPRDRWKRPIMNGTTYQRVTTLVGMVDDQYALTLWKMRRVAKGIAWRDDLRIAVATTDDSDQDGKNELDALCERAMDAAGANQGSAMGTAFHRVCQIAGAYPDIDPSAYCPPELRGELKAYRELIAHGGLVMPVEYQERTGICLEIGAAGTWDDLGYGDPCGRCACGRLHVVDKKSGQKEYEYGQGKVSAQLAIYARMTTLWLVTGNGYEPPPEICPEVGYVISVPIGRPDDAVIYPVDLEAGWERAQLAVQIREARSVKRGLFGEPMTLPGTRAVITPTSDVVVRPARKPRRIKAQIAADNEAAQHPGATKCPHGFWSDTVDCDECKAFMAAVIADSGGLPPEPAPATTGDTGTAFLMNGELKPGPAAPESNLGGIMTTEADSLGVPDVPDFPADVIDETDAVALLADKLGAESVSATVTATRPDAAQLDRERAAAYAGLANGTDARAELAIGELVLAERQALTEAIAQATGTADLETAYTLWSAHWTPEHDVMSVKRLISLTGTREGLDRIWETYQSVWTDDLTAAGNDRLAELARL